MLVVFVEEGVGAIAEKGQVGVHPRSLDPVQGLWHERGVDATLHCDLLYSQAERHDGISHCQSVGVLQVDLVLAGSILVERVLDRNGECLEHVEGALAQVR